jgi:hypothetical protein
MGSTAHQFSKAANILLNSQYDHSPENQRLPAAVQTEISPEFCTGSSSFQV